MTNGLNVLLLVVAVFGICAACVAGFLAARFYRMSLQWKRKAEAARNAAPAHTFNESLASSNQPSNAGLTLSSQASLQRKRGVGNFSYWPQTNSFIVDAGTLNLLGLPAVDHGGTLPFDVFMGAIQEQSRASLAEALTACASFDGGPFPIDVHFTALRRDAEVDRVAVLLEPVAATEGVPAHVAGLGWDVSDALKAERDLALTNERLQLALAATRVGLISVDAEASRVWLDATACRLFHVEQTQAAESHVTHRQGNHLSFSAWLSHVNSADRTELVQNLTARELKRGAVRRRITLTDGVTHLQLVTHRRPDAPDGISWIGVVWNVTTEVQREHALTIAREQAQAANLAKSRFLASMSHEIRTPLNAILGFSQLLSRDFTLSETQREQLLTVNQSGRNLLGILNDVLDMAKVETGAAALSEEAVDLAGVTHEIRKLYWPQASGKGLRLELDVALDLPCPLVFDVSRFRQIMNHLLTNALQYTSSGKISIGIAAQPTLDERYRICVRVSDTGPGIPESAQENIFSPFERGANAVESGTGLGLSISRDLARLLKGELSVESDGESGSTFVLTFLARSASNHDRFSSTSLGSRVVDDDHPVTALVVDDKESNRGLLSAILGQVGITVLLANSGQHALELLTTSSPDIAFLDLRMPDMSGFELAGRVKEDAHSAHIPLVAVSASAHEFASSPGAQWFAGFVAKPVNMAEVLEAISRHTNVRFSQTVTRQDQAELANDVAQTLAALTFPNRPELCDALESLDYNRFVNLLDRTPELPKAVREHLRALASRFDNETLLALLRLP